jgi:hypothetical protein
MLPLMMHFGHDQPLNADVFTCTLKEKHGFWLAAKVLQIFKYLCISEEDEYLVSSIRMV